MKRVFDCLFSLLVLLSSLPLFLLIAFLIKITSKGPIFYGSKRIGLHKRPIVCWKFRTMHRKAEKKLAELLERDPILKQEWTSHYKLRHDPRITKIGRFLRKTSLDELPQFWNVLKGDLSVVGPRPVSSEEATIFFAKKGDKMFSVRPGITGLWQTSGRSDLSYEKRLELEENYIDTHSFTLDLILILKTIPLMVFPRGAL